MTFYMARIVMIWNSVQTNEIGKARGVSEGARGLGKYIFPNQQDDLALAGTVGNYMQAIIFMRDKSNLNTTK